MDDFHSLSPLRRSVKRKLEQIEEATAVPSSLLGVNALARVEIENECFALREALSRQQMTINKLSTELDEEMNASSTAADEAMLMIVRLQREKAEVEMEARQCRRFADERMAHDEQVILMLEDGYFKRDHAVQALSFKAQAYKHRLLSYGVDPDNEPNQSGEDDIDNYDNKNNSSNHGDDENDGCGGPVYDYPVCDYPPLRCFTYDIDMNGGESINSNKYIDSPTLHEHLQHVEKQAYHMEMETSSSGQPNAVETKNGGFVGSHHPLCRRPKRTRQFSIESAMSVIERDCPQEGTGYFSSVVNGDGVDLRDEMNDDRVYTIDRVHGETQLTPKVGGDSGIQARTSIGLDELDIKKLYMRLQALEADRESLKQAIISMQTDKAQLVLLKEITKNLPRKSERKLVVKKQPLLMLLRLCYGSICKWITTLFFWKKRACHSTTKYSFGFSNTCAGLLYLLDTKTSTRQPWRCITRRRG